MKYIQKAGLYLFIIGIVIFTVNIFLGSFSFDESKIKAHFAVPKEIGKESIPNKGDTIANGFLNAITEYSSENSLNTSNLISFNAVLPQVIALHNANISKELVDVSGISEQEIESLLIAVESSGEVVYNNDVLNTVFGDAENKKQLLIDNTGWMFTESRTYNDIESFKNDLTNKTSEINGKIGQGYHIKSDGGSLRDLNKLLINSGAKSSPMLWFFLTFGLVMIGSIAYNLPNIKLLGVAGIKHNGIYHDNITNRGWLAWIVLFYLVLFYVLLIFLATILS